jgi:hypothetical protein
MIMVLFITFDNTKSCTLQHPLLDDDIKNRLTFVTMAMHAYGHQWACQVVYNPRFKDGIGLTDGEGVERFWSRMMILIGVERNSAVCYICLLL